MTILGQLDRPMIDRALAAVTGFKSRLVRPAPFSEARFQELDRQVWDLRVAGFIGRGTRSALNRSTSPSNRRTKPTSSVGVIRSSESLAPGDIPGLNQAFVNAPLPPGNLPRLPVLVTGADSRANHYHSELIRRRRVGKRLFPLVLAIAALSIVRVRAREFASVTRMAATSPRRPARPQEGPGDIRHHSRHF